MGNACGAGAKPDRGPPPPTAEKVLTSRGSAMLKDSTVHKRDVRDDYDLGRVLGEGAFGKVHAGTLKRTKPAGGGVVNVPGEGPHEVPCPDETCERAIKFLGAAALKASSVDNEINTMRRVSHHHNIVKLYDCYLHGDHFVMTLEMCLGGELFDRVVSHSKYTEREARTAFAQMVEAVGHCHAHEIVHRDLKPENMLYADREGTPRGHILKLADFGLADICDTEHHLRSICGSPGYIAPEILTRRGYGLEVDMWSLGVILYILLCGYPPFWDPSGSDRAVKRKIKAGDYEFDPPAWTNVSPGAKDLVSKLMVVDPSKRLTADGVFGKCSNREHCDYKGGNKDADGWMHMEHACLDFHIPHFCDNMHQYTLRKKFKGAVDAVISTRRMASKTGLLGKLFPAVTSTTSAGSDVPETVAEEPAAAADGDDVSERAGRA